MLKFPLHVVKKKIILSLQSYSTKLLYLFKMSKNIKKEDEFQTERRKLTRIL